MWTTRTSGFSAMSDGDGLRAGVGAEMRVADLELHAEPVGLFFHDRRPPFSEVDAHCDRHEGDRLALERLEVVGAPRIVDSLGDGVSRDPRERQATATAAAIFMCFISSSSRFKFAAL